RFQHGLKTERFVPSDGASQGAQDALSSLASDGTGACRCLAYSANGEFFAHCNSAGVKVRSLATNSTVDLPHPKAAQLAFSPCGTVLAVWEQYAVTSDNPQGSPNMNLYDSSTGKLLKSFVHKKADTWRPSWTDDSVVCARGVTGEVHCYQDRDFSSMRCRLSIAGLAAYSMSPGRSDACHVAAFIPGSRGQPHSVRVFRYPDLSPTAPVANKSLYKAESVSFQWNRRGTDLLLLTASEVSKDSYYGEQGLHYLSVRGESCAVPLQKAGPIYHTEWHPDCTQFVVTAGSMPAKTTVYNLRCEPVFDFGTGPRNVTYFNPFGNILCLAGFGNLKGDVELWDFANKRLMAKLLVPDATQFQWCSDGVHFVAATTSPRLRVNNCLTVYHYSGKVMARRDFDCLLEVAWRPQPACEPPKLRYDTSKSFQAITQQTQATRYVPPHLRNRDSGSASQQAQPRQQQQLHNYELPSNQRPAADGAAGGLSKAAVKNQRKKERKRAAATAGAPEAAAAGEQPGGGGALASFESTGDAEKDKRAKAILRKLQQIDKLRADQAAGKQLELNQMEKLKTEDELRQKLDELYL
uniref:Eukaryotic translation initiation factor 2A n=1 Tax=Macrostomum lignano TaxID=282301 RepID=A0A1I8H2P4_9PLAT